MARELPVMIMVTGGALLALWVYATLGERRPRSLHGATVHMLMAFAALGLVPLAFGTAVGAEPTHREALVALLSIVLPTMTYAFLASLYLLEQLQRRLGG